MFTSNAKKKISITSALFSLLILFFTLNCGFGGNFCSASNSGDDFFKKSDASEASRSEEETTNETETEAPKEGEEDENENNEEDKKEDEINQQENNEEEDKTESTETQKPKRGPLCPFPCTVC